MKCFNIENNINDINKINESVKKLKSIDFTTKFSNSEDEINKLLELIKTFGKIEIGKEKIIESKIEFEEELNFTKK